VTVDLLKAPFVPAPIRAALGGDTKENSPTPTPDAKGGIAHPNIGAARNRTDSLRPHGAIRAFGFTPSPAAHPAKRRQPASQRARFFKNMKTNTKRKFFLKIFVANPIICF
jgi:hypothetical protein